MCVGLDALICGVKKTVVSLNKIKDLGFRIYSMGGFAPSDFKIFVT